MSKTRYALVLLAGIALGLGTTIALRGGDVRAQAAACAQWETLVEDQAVTTVKEIPEYGKASIRKAPAGWEPFAVAPTSYLVYRRCAK